MVASMLDETNIVRSPAGRSRLPARAGRELIPVASRPERFDL